MPTFALIAAGADRPGIVAAVTGALAALDVNLADTTMVGLHGTFAMVLVVEAPPSVDAPALEAALAPVAEAWDLAVAVRPAVVADAPSSPGGRHTLTVYGGDHPGIVHGVASRIAAHGGNIVALETHVIGPPDRPVYAMALDLELPAGADAESLARDLTEAGRSLGVSCTLRAADADIL